MPPGSSRLTTIQPRRQPANLHPCPLRQSVTDVGFTVVALLCIPHFIVTYRLCHGRTAYRWIWADVAVTKWVRGLQCSKNNYKLSGTDFFISLMHSRFRVVKKVADHISGTHEVSTHARRGNKSLCSDMFSRIVINHDKWNRFQFMCSNHFF